MNNRKTVSVFKLVSILIVSIFLAGCSAALLDEGNGGSFINNSYSGTIGGKYAINSGDYATALTKSIQFFDANKCGTGVATGNTFAWRGNCHTGDTMANGYHDAGDHVKFGLPASYAFAVLGWSVYEFPAGFTSANKSKLVTDILRRFSDYFLGAYNKTAHTFYYDIGDGDVDHAYWGAPENQSGSRTSYQNSQAQGYADIGGLAAAGLALQYLNYQSYDTTYANTCLDEATNLYFDVKAHQYYNIPNSKGFYGINPSQVNTTVGGAYKTIWDTIEISDKLAMAAAFLYYADPGKKATYWADLKNYLSGNNRGGGAKNQDGWTMSWNDLYSPAFLKAYDIANAENDATKKTEYLAAINYNINYWKNSVPTSPGGMKVLSSWGNLRYNAAFAMIALKKIEIQGDSALQTLAKDQVDYILGDNPRNGSYVIGFGSNWPQSPHHRAANPTQSGTAQNTIHGMLLGGPSANNDSYTDNWSQYAMAEGGLDYNAGLVGALAAMVEDYGGGGGGGGDVIWDFDTTVDGWTAAHAVTLGASGGQLNITITGADPFTRSPAGLSVAASVSKYIIVRMKNNTSDTTASVFWTTSTGTWSGVRTQDFTISANDSSFKTYVINLSGNAEWTGTITQIRLDPSVNATSGSCNVDYIKISSSTQKFVTMLKSDVPTYAIDGNNGGADGQAVYIWTAGFGNINQEWDEIDRGGGYYSYQKHGTSYCLDGGNGGTNGQAVYLWTRNDGNQNQHWRKVNLGNGYFRLEKRNASGFSIDGGNGGVNGQLLKLWTSSDANVNQKWLIE